MPMSAHKIIFVSQEIAPYLSVQNGKFGRELPQAVQSHKYEVRTFMPDFGEVNERRNQLHEVIRLSGINIPISDHDHPLVVKVASMHPSRIQVYFIDNDDYFQKTDTDTDAFGTNRPDNDERAIFFAHGTQETARKLRWEPEVVQVSGWMCALTPLYMKRICGDPAAFKKSKFVYVVLPGETPAAIDENILSKLKAEGAKPADLKKLKEIPLDSDFFHKVAMTYSDAVVFQGVEPSQALLDYAAQLGIKVVSLPGDAVDADAYVDLYNSLMTKSK